MKMREQDGSVDPKEENKIQKKKMREQDGSVDPKERSKKKKNWKDHKIDTGLEPITAMVILSKTLGRG